jgi:hypothetical protein
VFSNSGLYTFPSLCGNVQTNTTLQEYTMNFFREIASQGRRVAVDILHAGNIERSSPWSPDVPEELTAWLPDLFDRFPITFP